MIFLTVSEIMRGPFEIGVSDCCTSACDVFERLHGIDPMADLRGTYRNEAEQQAIIRSFGGWRRMFETLGRKAGLRAGVGNPGEIGLIKNGGAFMLGIGLGSGRWAGRTADGFAISVKGGASWRK